MLGKARKSLKVSKETYESLQKVAGRLQKAWGRRVSVDLAISTLIKEYLKKA